MKVKFLSNGGFNKNGAFVEYDGDEPTGREFEYERMGYISFDILCDILSFRTIAPIATEKNKENVVERRASRSIVGEGVIQEANYGRFSLSFFGKRKKHNEVSVTIHQNDSENSVHFSGYTTEKDIDSVTSENFYIEINMNSSRFDALVSELEKTGTQLIIRIETWRFPNFFATWSPSISEGRVIKFLENKKDIENSEDIREDYWLDQKFQEELLAQIDSPPITIHTTRSLISQTPQVNINEDCNNDDLEEALEDALSTDFLDTKSVYAAKSESSTILTAQIKAITMLNAQVKQAGLMISACLFFIFLALILS